MTIAFTWQIESKDPLTGSMVVRFTPDTAPGAALSLNIPMPPVGVDVAEHVTQYAPANDWARAGAAYEEVEVGLGGASVTAPVMSSETPQVSGSWNEEYLRALIYQVLEEMKESAV
jgi:hypothetical protein